MPATILISDLPKPAATDAFVMKNCSVMGLTTLKQTGQLVSRDIAAPRVQGMPRENVKANIARMYTEASISPAPAHFCSLYVMITETFDSSVHLYGDGIALEVSWPSIYSDIVVFNGDTKNLGYKSQLCKGNTDFLAAFPGPPSIDELRENVRLLSRGTYPGNKRIRGDYVEARLLRPLLPKDISAIYLLPKYFSTDATTIRLAHELAAICS